MGIFDIFKKKQVSSEDVNQQLTVIAFENRRYFLEEILPKIAACLDIDIETYDMDIIGTATYIVCIWAAAKAMEPEDKQFMDIVYECSENDVLNKIMSLRHEDYNKAWNDSFGENQQILAKIILCDVIFNSEVNKKLDNIPAISLVNNFVVNIMKKNLKTKAEMGY